MSCLDETPQVGRPESTPEARLAVLSDTYVSHDLQCPALKDARREIAVERAKRRALQRQVDDQARQLGENRVVIGMLSAELKQCHVREREQEALLVQAWSIRYSTDEVADLAAEAELLNFRAHEYLDVN